MIQIINCNKYLMGHDARPHTNLFKIHWNVNCLYSESYLATSNSGMALLLLFTVVILLFVSAVVCSYLFLLHVIKLFHKTQLFAFFTFFYILCGWKSYLTTPSAPDKWQNVFFECEWNIKAEISCKCNFLYV